MPHENVRHVRQNTYSEMLQFLEEVIKYLFLKSSGKARKDGNIPVTLVMKTEHPSLDASSWRTK